MAQGSAIKSMFASDCLLRAFGNMTEIVAVFSGIYILWVVYSVSPKTKNLGVRIDFEEHH